MYGKHRTWVFPFFIPQKITLKNTKNRSYFFVIQENNRIFALKFY